MIFQTKDIQGIVDIMSELERINAKISVQYAKLYGNDSSIDKDHSFESAQNKVSEAVDSVGRLLASVLTRKE